MSSNREKRNKKCSTCRRPARDHPGPCGRKCSNFPLETDEEESVKDYPGLKKHTRDDTDTVLRELADQMGQLTVSMQHMQEDLGDVKQELHEVRNKKPDTETRTRASDCQSGGGAPSHTTEANQCLPSGAKVSQRVVNQAKNGEFINLGDFAPCLEPSLTTETSIVEGELVFKPKRTIKSMDSFLLWSLAWRSYEELLVQYNPSLYPGLCAYRIFVQTCAAKHWWPSVYSYDVRNRAKHSMTNSFDFHHLDNDIYVTTFDATTIKPNVKQCSRCKSIWHTAKDCPFSEEGALAQTPRTPTNQGQQNQSSRKQANASQQSNQVCFNWNAGRCTDNRCVRRHVCERCGGREPLPRCANCNYGNPITQPGPVLGNKPSYATPPPSHNTVPAGRMG